MSSGLQSRGKLRTSRLTLPGRPPPDIAGSGKGTLQSVGPSWRLECNEDASGQSQGELSRPGESQDRGTFCYPIPVAQVEAKVSTRPVTSMDPAQARDASEKRHREERGASTY